MKERLWKPGNAFSGKTGVRLSEEYGEEGGNSAMPVFQCQCALSAKGKVVEKIEAGPQGRDVFSYEYDAAGHLTLVRKNELLWEYYQYDGDGRRIQDFRAWAGGKRLLTYYYTGELIQAGDTELEWTDKGQLAALKQQGRRTAFAYGQDTRLDRALLADGQDVRYFYGQELLPVKVTRNGSVAAEYQWHDTLRLRRHKDALNGLVHEFVYGDRRAPVQCIVSGTQEAVYNATGLYERSLTLNVWTDQVDSIRVLSLPDGRPVKCIEYDAFGNVAADTRPEWKFPLGFACGLNDHFTGLVRFGFRDYDPRFGRFTAKDPIGYSGGDNDLWDYCVDDPVGCLDPDGLLTRATDWNRSDPHSRDAARGASDLMLSDEERKAREAMGRQLGLGVGANIDGVLHMGDMAAAPMRAALNYGNELLGGDANYFQPTRGNVTNMLGLPKPETERERRIYAFNEAAASALAGAGVLGGTQAGMAALNATGNLIGKGVQYGSAAAHTAAAAGRGAYDKAKPVVENIATSVRDTSRQAHAALATRNLDTTAHATADFAEGFFIPVSPSLSSPVSTVGTVAKHLYDEHADDFMELAKRYLQPQKRK